MYYRAESHNQLGMLDANMLTVLIGLFGSLSAHPSRVYPVPLAYRLSPSTRRTYWTFILKVGKYKSARGLNLDDSDHFWLMRARLAIVPHSEPLSVDTYRAVLRARTHYRVIRRRSHHPEVHANYFDALVTSRDSRLLDLAARDLSFLLQTHRVCHQWLQRFFHRFVIHYGQHLSIQAREAILAALWGRIRRGTSNLVPENGMTLGDCNSDATELTRSVSTALFSSPGHFSNDKHTNFPGHLSSVFSPTYTVPLRWNSLVLISIFNSSESNRSQWTNNSATPHVNSHWQVIFGLAIVEKILQEIPAFEIQATTVKEIQETTRSLYQLWLSSTKDSCMISRDISCAVATSFLKIASILADAPFFYDCQDLYHMENTLKSKESVPKRLAAQYIAAAVRIQGALSDVVRTAVKTFSPNPKQQCQVLASAIEILAPIDASLAHMLYNVAQAKGMEPDSRTNHTLAMSLARRGALPQAVLFLSDSGFSPEARGILLSAIARSLRQSPRAHHPPSVFTTIVRELAALYQSRVPPEHFRGHLEQLLVTLARHGKGRQLYPVVISILRRLPGFFQPRFFDRYCRAMIMNRQFSTASKLVDAIVHAHPKIARSLRIFANRIKMQTKVSRVLTRTPLRGPASLKLSSHLRHYPHSGTSLECSLQELLRSGRILAAKHIFASVAATISSSRCTALGNILIHGVSCQPTPRNGRRIRKIISLLESLVNNHGFRPDRVTANILIKVMISWRSAYDSPRLRNLFDQLVRGGYPVAEYSSLHPPFGTQHTRVPSSSSLSKLTPFVSFERHSRPLFKMFIKAFYSCNDVEAARKVVGILKVEQYKHAVAKQARQSARTRDSD